MSVQTIKVPVTDLVYSGTNPRKSMDAEALKQLGHSIKTDGLVQPIVIRKHAKNHGKYEVVCGERRARAAKLAGVETLDAIVRDLSDLQVRELQHVENIQREDVSAIDQANSFSELMKLDPTTYTVDHLAERFSIGRRSVYTTLQLLKLHPAVQKLLADGLITAGHALLVAPLRPEAQKAFTENLQTYIKRGQVPTVREIKRMISEGVLRNLHAAPFKKDDPTLDPKMGPCTTCRYNTSVDPEAYPDEPKDRCMSPTCYEHKVTVFLERRGAQLDAEAKVAHKKDEAAPANVARIVTEESWRLDPAKREKYAKSGVLAQGNYREVKPNAKGAIKALVVDGPSRGTVKFISTDPVEKTDVRGRHLPSKAEKKSRAKEIHEQRIKALAKAQILTQIRQRTKLNADTLRWFVKYAIGRSYDTKGIARALGWTNGEAVSKYDDALAKAVDKHLAKASANELASLAMFAIVFTDDPFGAYSGGGGGRALDVHIKSLMTALKIDPMAIRKQVEKESMAKTIAAKLPGTTAATVKRQLKAKPTAAAKKMAAKLHGAAKMRAAAKKLRRAAGAKK